MNIFLCYLYIYLRFMCSLFVLSDTALKSKRMTVPQLRNALKGMAKTCLSKTGVDPGIAAATRKGEFPPDPKLQCYFLCVFGQMKILKEGKLSLDSINKQIDAVMVTDVIARAKEVSAGCYDSADSTEFCEHSWQFIKCFFETDQSIYFFP
nr:odorant-binding protein 2 [Gregopimpla kuwanae]